ncbi:unnamed protein product [Cuscuta europaea]|uniref:B box-type domain-containing protein n=1 Tax=Cuscuta europaea TaxID=41803 RepID=A0A9P1DWL5_CUSEU|nr:unnamed protein product [Cuscuta europaea]
MKIQCDVCEKEEATFFCSADEAALCGACDGHVHEANLVAGKHLRFTLLYHAHHLPPPSQQVCDICKDKRALLFCKEERAVLCGGCDLQIHTANERTQKHSRFLLTGIKLSASNASPATTGDHPDAATRSSASDVVVSEVDQSGEGSVVPGGASSISEYLLETIPGWHVQDFLEYEF